MNKKLIGAWGEQVAKNYLTKNNYQILESNWRHGHKELDIIAFKNIIVAIEVKVRKNDQAPAFTILKAAQVSRLRQTLLAYCRLKHFNYKYADLDLIVISPKCQSFVKLHHYRHI